MGEESEELELEQSEEGQEQTEIQDEDSFTNINPEELPEELRALYKSMQADYTRKTQALAADRGRVSDLERDAKLFNDLMSDDVVRDRVYQLAKGEQTANADTANREIEVPDAENDPIGYLTATLTNTMRQEVSTQISSLKKDIMPLINNSVQQREESDFNTLVAKYPYAKTVGREQLQRTMRQYPNLSMEQAFKVTAPVEALTTKRTTTKPPAKVEKPSTSTGGEGKTRPSLTNLQNLQREAADRRKNGMTNLGEIARNALSKIKK